MYNGQEQVLIPIIYSMAHFAKIDSNNNVIDVVKVENSVITDSNGVEQEQIGIDFLQGLFPEEGITWKQTSINTFGGKHYGDNYQLSNTQEKAFRKNYAAIGGTYDPVNDAFIAKKPYDSFVLDPVTFIWEPPIPMPETYTKNLTDADGNPLKDAYIWNEENYQQDNNTGWVLFSE